MDKSVITNLVSKCWQDTTGLSIESANLNELTNGNELYIASVVFTGEGQGSMTIAMGKALAKIIASKMFASAIDSVSLDDIKDSIGELANVLAGNIKTDFFGRSELSRPLVMQGSNALLSVLKIDVIFEEIFLSEDKEQVIIQVCQTE